MTSPPARMSDGTSRWKSANPSTVPSGLVPWKGVPFAPTCASGNVLAEPVRLEEEADGGGGRAGGVAGRGRGDVAAARRHREAPVGKRGRGGRWGGRGGRKGSRGDDHLRVQLHPVEHPPSTV